MAAGILTGLAFGAGIIALAWLAARKIARVEFAIEEWGDWPALPDEMGMPRKCGRAAADGEASPSTRTVALHSRAVDNS